MSLWTSTKTKLAKKLDDWLLFFHVILVAVLMSWMNENRIRSPVQRDRIMRRRRAHNPKEKRSHCVGTQKWSEYRSHSFSFDIPRLLSSEKTPKFSWDYLKALCNILTSVKKKQRMTSAFTWGRFLVFPSWVCGLSELRIRVIKSHLRGCWICLEEKRLRLFEGNKIRKPQTEEGN